jgi:hypothetical protein
VLDITASSGTSETLDVVVEGKSPATGVWAAIPGAVFAQALGGETQVLTIYPGIAETANVSVNDVLPSEIRVDSTIGGTATPTFVYSVGASLVP